MALSDSEKVASPFEEHPFLSKLNLIDRLALQAELVVALRNVNAQGHIAGIAACSELCADIATNVETVKITDGERKALLALIPTFQQFAIDFLKQNNLLPNSGLYDPPQEQE